MSAPEMWSRVKVYPRVAQDPSIFVDQGFYLGTTDDGLKFGVRGMPGYIYGEYSTADYVASPDRDPAPPGVYDGGKRRRSRATRRTTRNRRARRRHTRKRN